MSGNHLDQKGKRILKVAAWCFAIGWATYFAVLLFIYHIFAPSIVMPDAASALSSDEQTVVLAQAALTKAGEDPAGFVVRANPEGSAVTRSTAKQVEAVVDFKSTRADLRVFRVTLTRDGKDVICRVVQY